MTYTFTPVDPARDASLIHRWVTEPRAVHWGMLDRSVEEVEAIWAPIAEADDWSSLERKLKEIRRMGDAMASPRA